MIKEINNLEGVRSFIKHVIEEGVNIHPDDDFNNIVNVQSGKATYTAPEAALRNYLMQRAFEVCEASQADIYDISMEVFLTETGLSEFIPLPGGQER